MKKEGVIIIVAVVGMYFASIILNIAAYRRLNTAITRTESLNKRADVMQKEWAALDKRIRKQEGIKHGFGY